jgi:hypothetical protein
MSLTKPQPHQDLYQSAAFNPSSLSIYHFGLYLEGDSLLYAISNVQDELLFLRQYKNRDGLEPNRFMETVWQQDDYFRKRFAQVLLLVEADKWLPLPAEYVPDGSEGTYLAAYYEIGESALAHYSARKDVIRGTGAAVNYAVDASLAEFFTSRLSSATLLHAAARYTELTRALVLKPLSQRPFTGIVWIYMGRFYYVLYQGEKLIIVNRYSAVTAEDVMYYIQGIHNQLGIAKSDVGIGVAGYSVLKPYVATLLYRFFGAGYRDVSKLFSASGSLKEAGLGPEDALFLTLWGRHADSSG